MHSFPTTDLVILAGGQSRRMKGENKLLLSFDNEPQLLKIYHAFQGVVANIWVNSHRDLDKYKQLIPNILIFPDDTSDHLGPLMGMKSTWQYVQSDYVLFIPCDITFIPEHILPMLHQTLTQSKNALVAYVEINQQALYPFCLMKRASLPILEHNLKKQKLSLKYSFAQLYAQNVQIQNASLLFHSLNSFEELAKYK